MTDDGLASVHRITANWRLTDERKPTITAGELATLLAITDPDEPVYVGDSALSIVQIEHINSMLILQLGDS